MAANNSTIMAKAWLEGGNDFQQRIPDPSQSQMEETIEALFDPMNKQYYNQFLDILVNRIGQTYAHNKRWENKLRAFKRNSMVYGNTIQEIAPKWIKAHSYQDDEETLLKLNRPEVGAWYHSVNRQDRYDISINEIELRRAFTTEYGLNELVASIMTTPQNSDSYDEYLCMKQLIAFYEDNWGFYKENVSAIVDESTAKAFLTKARAYAERLQFPSTLYNASVITDIPVFAQPEELILITTPEVNSTIDVQALAALFHLDKAELKYRTVIIDEFPIPNAQALLTTSDWFVVSDVVYTTASFWNAQTLSTNYYLHHHEIISASPFVPAILFTTGTGTVANSIEIEPTGIELTADAEYALRGGTLQLHTALEGTVDPGGEGIALAPNAATFHIELSEDSSGELNSRTRVDRNGVLHIQRSGLEDTAVIVITATSTYVNPSGETTTLTSDELEITIGEPEPDPEP